MDKFIIRITKGKTQLDSNCNPDEPAPIAENEFSPPTKKLKLKMSSIGSTDLNQNLKNSAPDDTLIQTKEQWPSVWSFDQWMEKKGKYPWLFCSIIHPNKKNKLSNLRNKIKRHVESQAHEYALTIKKDKESQRLVKNMEAECFKNEKSTEHVFRTAYFIAKYNRPYDDHQKLIELQKVNGVHLGSTLHSRYSSTSIVSHIASKMRERIVKNIIESGSKLAVLIDESTTLSSATSMIVYIKTSISNEEPIFIFLDLIELFTQNAENIVNQLLKCLHECGFNDNFLKENWISFVSDGASVLLGKKNGVAKRLKDIYPLIFTWHCLNHRLELAVNDSVNDITSINHFKAFLDSLYALYNRSPKNQNELKKECAELDVLFLKIGRVLTVRWVASSFRAVQVIWKTYPALYQHLSTASKDDSRDTKSRSKYLGLCKRLESIEFVLDLALMCDVLLELSNLSKELQQW
ncbi:E3 SUMO-protein ligase KIAA1586-like [Metopolophium dirhodum]|uniref:E3 SUMO-protein ligase KIAA1586-like n=1 Tax=Metopolophium dirhodum TaxID=44670 RepID=UPI00298F9BB5|nr:E3 SUMO-protein ligase KIAA1586-like [Metopolophium dirhodum]